MTPQLIRFEPFEAGDGELWIAGEDVHHITKAPNRRTAARVFFYADGRLEYFDTKMTPEDAATMVNAARATDDNA